MTTTQKIIIKALAKLIREIDPTISQIRSERIAPLVPVYLVDLESHPISDELVPVKSEMLEAFIRGVAIGIESERE